MGRLILGGVWRACVALLLSVTCSWLVLPPGYTDWATNKLPDEQILLDALANAITKRQGASRELRLLDMSHSPPREHLASSVKLCEGQEGVTLRTEDGSSSITLSPFILSEDGKRIEGLDAMDDAAKLGALFLLSLCEPHPIKILNKTGSMNLDPARRQLLAEEASRPSEGFFYRLDDPEEGSGLELDFELERVLRVVIRQERKGRALEVVLLSEGVAERGEPPKPVSVWRYALRRGKKVLWIVEVS